MNLKSQFHRNLLLLSGFCIAMGVLEAVVVVYLRQIYYPLGFEFPLKIISPEMAGIEWIREIATIIMLVIVGIIAGKDNLSRFFYFLYSFAIWDLSYYAGLKVFLNWPSSFLTWDILFLIPVPWISPVLAPVICSITMIVFAVSMLRLHDKGYPLHINLYEWTFLILGSLIILYSFIQDYFSIFIHTISFSTGHENEYFWTQMNQYKPMFYNWDLFALGEMMIVCVIVYTILKMKANK